MSGALSTSPLVLTPSIVRSMNGSIDSSIKKQLDTILRECVEVCFRPLESDHANVIGKSNQSEGIKRFHTFRIQLLEMLLPTLSPEKLEESARIAQREIRSFDLSIFQELDIPAAAFSELLEEHADRLHQVLSAGSTGQRSQNIKPVSSDAFLEELMWTGSRWEYSLTGIFLALEKEIKIAKTTARGLFNASKRDWKRVDKYLAAYLGDRRAQRSLLQHALALKGLVSGRGRSAITSEHDALAALVRMQGTPLSQMIIEDRR